MQSRALLRRWPHRTRQVGLPGGPLHHLQHTEGPAREVHMGGRSSGLRIGSCASKSRPDTAPRRSTRARSAIRYRRPDNNRPACWACAGQDWGRHKPALRTIPPLLRRLPLRVSGARRLLRVNAISVDSGILSRRRPRRRRYRQVCLPDAGRWTSRPNGDRPLHALGVGRLTTNLTTTLTTVARQTTSTTAFRAC
jgi:hypothetical protein